MDTNAKVNGNGINIKISMNVNLNPENVIAYMIFFVNANRNLVQMRM